jgi:hypothetical protein
MDRSTSCMKAATIIVLSVGLLAYAGFGMSRSFAQSISSSGLVPATVDDSGGGGAAVGCGNSGSLCDATCGCGSSSACCCCGNCCCDCASNCGCGSCCDCGCCYFDYYTQRLYGSYSRLNDPNTIFSGWVNGGIMGNSFNPATHFNGPVTFADRDNGQLNQVYGVLRRTTDLRQNCGFFIGGQIDFFFGSDFFFTTAAGLDGTTFGNFPRWNSDRNFLYGYSMPQLYAETDYNDFRIKWGHFYTILGYETIPAVGNFFYTHSYALQYGQPFTHTGMLASRSINDYWTWNAGVVSGWNQFDLRGGAQFLGGLTYVDQGYGSLAFSIVSGNESDFNFPNIGPTSNRTMYSLVWTRNVTSRLTYVLHHSLGVQQDTLGFNALNARRASWYGINQYLFYQINSCWTAGARVEWFDDPQGYLVTGLRPGNTDARFRFPGSFYEASLGLNYRPTGSFLLRGELRYDWTTAQAGFFAPAVPGFPPNQAFGDNTSRNQFLFGLDAIYQY